MYIHICITESFCYTTEDNTVFLINYTSIKNFKEKIIQSFFKLKYG